MHLDISGLSSPSAPVLVLSAGLGGLGSFWQPQLAALRKAYRVVIYDQRGTGRSPATLPADYSLPDMAEELAAALAAQAITRFAIVGHALGGLVAMQLALSWPERVTRLVMVNGWLRLDTHTRRCFQVRQDLLLNVGVEAYVRAQPLFLYPADWMVENAARIEAEDALHNAHFQGTENLLRRLHALMSADFTHQAALVTQPVLLICSQDDVLVPSGCSRKLYEALPNATLETLPRGGHAVSVTESTAFNALLLTWLGETAPAHFSPEPLCQKP